MGERQNRHLQFSFNTSLKVDFQGSRITSDAGPLLVRELDERLGLSQLISDNLKDERRGRNTQLPFSDLLRQSICSRLAGKKDYGKSRAVGKAFLALSHSIWKSCRCSRIPTTSVTTGSYPMSLWN
jgi:hypothetical protein